MSSSDSFGDRIKAYESATETIVPLSQGLIVRVDGRAFHTLTRPLHRFSEKDGLNGWPSLFFVRAMVNAAKAVSSDFRPDITYVQSDEVTFAWFPREGPSEFPFGGRVQKLASLCASKMSVVFYRELQTLLPELLSGSSSFPIFDGRCFAVPTPAEVGNAVLWRLADADKNAIQTIARKRYGRKDISGVSNAKLRKSLFLLDSDSVRTNEEEPSRLSSNEARVLENFSWYTDGVGQLFFQRDESGAKVTDLFSFTGLSSQAFWKMLVERFPEHFSEKDESV